MTYRFYASIGIVSILLLTTFIISQSPAAVERTPAVPGVQASNMLQLQGMGTKRTAPVPGMTAGRPEVTVEMQFALPGRRLIALQAFNANGEKIAQSRTIDMTAERAGSSPVTFAFAEDAQLRQAVSFMVVGSGDRAALTSGTGSMAMVEAVFQ